MKKEDKELFGKVGELMESINTATRIAFDVIDKEPEGRNVFVSIASHFIAAYLLLGMNDPYKPEYESPREMTQRLIDNRVKYRGLLDFLQRMYITHLGDIIEQRDQEENGEGK